MLPTARNWLIAALNHAALPELMPQDWPDLLSEADSGGVTVFLDYRLRSHPESALLPAGLLDAIKAEAKQAVLRQLPFYAEQRGIFQALDAAGVPFLVLKGAALGQWLYASPTHRPVTDIDLWFADRDAVCAAAEVLHPLGYVPVPSGGDLTTWQWAFDKPSNGLKIRIDAHWALFNSALLNKAISFDAAFARSRPLGMQAQTQTQTQTLKALSPEDALINAIGHRALKQLSGQADTLKWLVDQQLLFKSLDSGQWQAVLERCTDAGISDLALEALEQSQRIFRTPVPPEIASVLSRNAGRETIKRQWFRSWPRYQWREMQAVSPLFSVRLRWLAQKLLPNPEAMREGYGEDDPVWKFMLRRFGVGLKRLFFRS